MGQCEQTDTGGADPRSKNRDAPRVSSKVTDVLTDPAQSLNLIQEPVVSFRCLVPGAEEAWSFKTQNRASTARQIYNMCHSFDQKLHHSGVSEQTDTVSPQVQICPPPTPQPLCLSQCLHYYFISTPCNCLRAGEPLRS